MSSMLTRVAAVCSSAVLVGGVVAAIGAGDPGSTARRGPVGVSAPAAVSADGTPRTTLPPGVVATPAAPPSEGGAAGAAATASTAGGRASTSNDAPGAEGSAGPIPVGPGVHGVTDSTIELGVPNIDIGAGTAVVSSVSGQDHDFGTGQSIVGARAVADHINANGGIAGRELVLVPYDVNVANAATSSGRDQESQRACAHWTEDHHVFAMMGWVVTGRVSCARQTNTVIVADSVSSTQEAVTYPDLESVGDLWYSPAGLVSEQRERAIVEGLAQEGFFSADARVGILVEADPGRRHGVDRGMIPALEALGIDVVRVIEYPDPIESAWPNYMLQLAGDGVTHIVASSSDGGPYMLMSAMRAAENQRYRPNWGIASDLSPAGARTLGAPVEQLRNVRGVGWTPPIDLGNEEAQSANAETCTRIRKEVGQVTVAFYCETFMFLKFALDRAEEVSPAGLSAALERVGTEYESPWTMGGSTRFASSRHAGATTYRIFAFDPRCEDSGANCFRYVTDAKTFPD